MCCVCVARVPVENARKTGKRKKVAWKKEKRGSITISTALLTLLFWV